MPAKQLILDLAIRYGFEVLGAFVILGAGISSTNARAGESSSAGDLRRLDLAIVVPYGERSPAAALTIARDVVTADLRAISDHPRRRGSPRSKHGGSSRVNPWVQVPDVVATEAALYQNAGRALPRGRDRRSPSRRRGPCLERASAGAAAALMFANDWRHPAWEFPCDTTPSAFTK